MIEIRPRTRRAALRTMLGLGTLGATGVALSGPIDFATLFSGPVSGPSQNVKFRQGTIITFDQNTLANTISVGGSTLTNLPILGVAEASTLTPGSSVGVLVVGDGDQAKTMFIVGRSVIPGTPDAVAAVTLLNSQISSSFLIQGESTTSTTFTDLATVGPQVTVNVGPSGRLLIFGTTQIQWIGINVAHVRHGGLFDVAFTGANTRVPDDTVDPLVGVGIVDENVSAGFITVLDALSITTQAVFDGLNPGPTNICMKYRQTTGASTAADFHRRGLTVVKL